MIYCNACHPQCIGHTIHKLKVRIAEHISGTFPSHTINSGAISGASQHFLESGEANTLTRLQPVDLHQLLNICIFMFIASLVCHTMCLINSLCVRGWKYLPTINIMCPIVKLAMTKNHV